MSKIFITCKETKIESPRKFYGCFCLGPFEENQSLTIANALRRTLLSECKGLAITSVLIENVTHEYGTLNGVRESVLDILLNLKEIVIKKVQKPWLYYKKKGILPVFNNVGTAFFKPVLAYLRIKGPGVVKAKDLHLPPFIQCVDPEQYITTLTDDGFLNLKCVIMEGKGYTIQKPNNLVDNNIVKKRQVLFEQLKNLLKKTSSYSQDKNLDLLQNSNNKKMLNLFELSNVKPLKEVSIDTLIGIGITKKLHNFITIQPHKKNQNKEFKSNSVNTLFENTNSKLKNKNNPSASSSCFAQERIDKIESTIKLNNQLQPTTSKFKTYPVNSQPHVAKTTLFKTQKILNLDAIFSPVTKVNYIIEVNENKIVDQISVKNFFVKDLSTLLESQMFLQKNLPFLNKILPLYKQIENCQETHIDFDDSNSGFHKKQEINFNMDSSHMELLESIFKFVDSFTTEEFYQNATSIHPLSYIKDNSLHSIFLEIWTNGSIHPREALCNAFENLAIMFLNFEKTKIYNPIYKNSSSLQKSLIKLKRTT